MRCCEPPHHMISKNERINRNENLSKRRVLLESLIKKTTALERLVNKKKLERVPLDTGLCMQLLDAIQVHTELCNLIAIKAKTSRTYWTVINEIDALQQLCSTLADGAVLRRSAQCDAYQSVAEEEGRSVSPSCVCRPVRGLFGDPMVSGAAKASANYSDLVTRNATA